MLVSLGCFYSTRMSDTVRGAVTFANMVAVANRTPLTQSALQQAGRRGTGGSPCGHNIPGSYTRDMYRKTVYRLELVGLGHAVSFIGMQHQAKAPRNPLG